MNLFTYGTSKLRKVFEQQGFEFDDEITQYKNPVNRILKYIDKNTCLLLIHNVYSSEEDVERVSDTNVNTTWVLCPNSNLYIEKTLPPVTMLYNKAQNIAIGTDSLSSNTNISMIEELKTLNTNFPHISINNLFQWATLGGAKALKIDAKYGSFKIGKYPGVVLIENFDFENIRLLPQSTAKKLV